MPSFNDYSIASYGSMINDRGRTAPFVEALRCSILPGSVVLDIGTGTGIFAFLACRFGAARVYAIEPDAQALAVAQACAKGILGAERITWMKGLSTKIDLPERVDVVVGDLHGTLPFFKGNIESLVDARKRHLKPGGHMIPRRDLLYAVPASAAEEFRHIERPWQANDFGLDLSPAAPYVFNQWTRARKEPATQDQLMAVTQLLGEVNYSTGESFDLDQALEWVISRAGTLHGLYVWFDGDLGEGIGYSNAPTLPELVYGRAFFPFEQAIDVTAGDKLHTHFSVRLVKGSYVFRWDSRISDTSGNLKARFRQSTFKSWILSPELIHKSASAYVPILNQEGEIQRCVLEAMAQSLSLEAIATALLQKFPQQFNNNTAALDKVVSLSQLFT